MTSFSTSTANDPGVFFPAQADQRDLFPEARGTPFTQPPDRAQSCRTAGQQLPVG
ncbi:MAG: hypothetical protein ACKOHM_02610 [Spartobacteria bacterium]